MSSTNRPSTFPAPVIQPAAEFTDELSAKIQRLLDDDLSFVERHLAEDGNDLDTVKRVSHEFRRFAALHLIAEQELVPTEAVDGFWHTFLVFTKQYQSWCDRHFGATLHHNPRHASGSGWDRTVVLMKEVFGLDWEKAAKAAWCTSAVLRP